MTPEQLEAIEGIGPKTVEKISLAVNNYFASLEGVAPGDSEGELIEGVETVPEEAGQELAAEGEQEQGSAATESEPAAAENHEQQEDAAHETTE